MIPCLRWSGCRLLVTRHCDRELTEYGKDTLFLLEVLNLGEHRIVSKRERKHEAVLRRGRNRWKLVYARDMLADQIYLIHLGFETGVDDD